MAVERDRGSSGLQGETEGPSRVAWGEAHAESLRPNVWEMVATREEITLVFGAARATDDNPGQFDADLAHQVAVQLMAKDALGAHTRDELGISEAFSARPIQAALTSAGSFAVGAALPLLAVAAVPQSSLIPVVSVTSLVFLAILGGLAARVGGAKVATGAVRVTFWGALAMALTAGVGALFGTVV